MHARGYARTHARTVNEVADEDIVDELDVAVQVVGRPLVMLIIASLLSQPIMAANYRSRSQQPTTTAIAAAIVAIVTVVGIVVIIVAIILGGVRRVVAEGLSRSDCGPSIAQSLQPID